MLSKTEKVLRAIAKKPLSGSQIKTWFNVPNPSAIINDIIRRYDVDKSFGKDGLRHSKNLQRNTEMAASQAMRETVLNLDAISALIAEWKKTPEHNHGTRARICVEMDALFKYRSDWSRKHQPSYIYATKKGLVRRKAGINQFLGYSALDWTSMQSKISAARTELHQWCVDNKLGYHDEHQAGESLIKLMKDGVTASVALQDVKLSVKIGK